jgi:hypothetical protein
VRGGVQRVLCTYERLRFYRRVASANYAPRASACVPDVQTPYLPHLPMQRLAILLQS